MKAIHDGIRKAAILVSSLDRRAADLVLDGIPADDAQQVRHRIIELGPIDPDEERRVLEEFFRMTSPASALSRDRTEAEGGLSSRAGSASGSARDAGAPSGKPFRFLQQTECDKLARILLAERPQTIALVLSHLPPEQAGGVLTRFPSPLQVDVIRRLVDLEETAPEILREVEHALESRLSEHLSMQRRRVAGLKAVAGILEASESHVGAQILTNLAAHDRDLADKLGPPEIDFNDFVRLDSRSLTAILETAEPELVMLALVGASPDLCARILAALPEEEASALQHHLDHPGPTRLSDVEEARRRLAETAHHLSIQRRLKPPVLRPRLQ